jgi:hypothetical protein
MITLQVIFVHHFRKTRNQDIIVTSVEKCIRFVYASLVRHTIFAPATETYAKQQE